MAWVFNPFTGTFDYSIISAGGVLPPSSGGTGTSTVFTQGSVVFAGASGVYAQDNANFFWDDANNRLGIGTATPTARFTLIQTTAGETAASITGVTGAKIIVDSAGTGSNFYDADVQTWRKSNGTTTQLVLNPDGNLFLNATAKAWLTSVRALDIAGYAGIAQGLSGACIVGFNTYLNTSGQYAYKASTAAALYACGQGGAAVHSWSVAASGTSDGAITFTRAMTLDANSNLLIGTTTSPSTATRSLTLANGTAPTAVATTTLAMYSSNLSANNTIPSVWTEGTGITTAGITNTTVTNKIAIRVNGTVYYLLATTNGT